MNSLSIGVSIKRKYTWERLWRAIKFLIIFQLDKDQFYTPTALSNRLFLKYPCVLKNIVIALFEILFTIYNDLKL